MRIRINIVLTALLVSALGYGLRDRSTRPLAGVALVLLFGTILTGLIYGVWFSDIRQFWYRAQPGFVLFIETYAVVMILAVRGLAPTLRTRLVAAAVVIVSTVLFVVRLRTVELYPYQRDVLASQVRFNEVAPTNELIGCFNAGIPAFFSDRPIVNLDGLVNNAVYPYYRRNAFDAYLQDAHIRYIADEVESFRRAMKFTRRPVSVEVIESAPLSDSPFSVRYLWRVDGAP